MTTLKHFVISSLIILSLQIGARAQTPRVNTINITAEADKVHIAAQGDVTEIRIEVVSEAGDVVFESGAISGNTLDWNMADAQGERVQPGTYNVTVTFRAASGKLRKRLEQVTVSEAEKSSAETATTAKPAAPQAVQAAIDGSGVANSIAKFTDANTIINSTITETPNGYVGIGTTAPGVKLNLRGANSRLRLESTASNLWTTVEYFTNNRVWHTGVGGSNVSTDVKGKYYIRDHTAGAERLVIDTYGNVGIGTTSPDLSYKLSVLGGSNSAIYGENTNIGVRGFGKIGVFGESRTAGGTGVDGTGYANGSYGVRGTTNGADSAAIYGFAYSGGQAGRFDGRVAVNGALTVSSCTGCTISSDQNLKTNFSTVNPRFVLDRLSAIPIKSWNYKSDEPSVRHIGPMAQDFRSAFNLGADDKHIDMIDANGVTMAAIQGLYQQNQELKSELQQLRAQVTQQQTQLNQVKRTIRSRRATRKH